MPILLIAGLAVLILGLVLLIVWFGYLWLIIKAVLPLGLIGAGAVISYLGWEEWRENRSRSGGE